VWEPDSPFTWALLRPATNHGVYGKKTIAGWFIVENGWWNNNKPSIHGDFGDCF